MGQNSRSLRSASIVRMRELITVLLHFIVVVARLVGPGGARSVAAESVLVKHQLLILNRSRKRAPNLRASDRIIVGLCTLLMRPARVLRSAIVLKPSTLLNFHNALVHRKYRLLFSAKHRRKSGPKGPSPDLIRAVVDMKRRNPVGAALELRSKSRWPSASRSTRMQCVASYAFTTGPNPIPVVHPGSLFSGTRRTVCGAWICFDASLLHCERIGCWS